ncbi:ScbA/BarX family gamma-butyrolactone biosynthesis protein [Streptomyces prasinopilosus]|uniref:ScbA/BarX family gamma-butyrolactone biosynthesis protein n=1 Tax=Streptomyces prasinopilosus TaxID=67344 RepID=UPI0006EB540E|nr:ScbA/BarX family gamma-butyrolactone biosynthesis protein [Streptomyces prasinopilosus]
MNALLQADRPYFGKPEECGPELFEQTVPRTLVHRAAVSEVLLTGWQTVHDEHRLGAQWSRAHSYYGSVDGRWHDPMLFAETIRQACLLLAHEALDVPLGFGFLTESTAFEVDEERLRLSRPAHPAHVVLDMRLSHIKRRGGVVSSYAYDVVAHRDGERLGSGRLRGKCTSQAVYRRLRGERIGAGPPHTAIAPVDPRLVGRDDESDVVLGASAGAGAHPLRIVADHPVLFDHPVDHVPGMVLMEAARQAGLLALGAPHGLLVACEAQFRRYVEFHIPCLVATDEPEHDGGGRHTVTVRFLQDGSEAGSCRVGILTTAGEADGAATAQH